MVGAEVVAADGWGRGWVCLAFACRAPCQMYHGWPWPAVCRTRCTVRDASACNATLGLVCNASIPACLPPSFPPLPCRWCATERRRQPSWAAMMSRSLMLSWPSNWMPATQRPTCAAHRYCRLLQAALRCRKLAMFCCMGVQPAGRKKRLLRPVACRAAAAAGPVLLHVVQRTLSVNLNRSVAEFHAHLLPCARIAARWYRYLQRWCLLPSLVTLSLPPCLAPAPLRSSLMSLLFPPSLCLTPQAHQELQNYEAAIRDLEKVAEMEENYPGERWWQGGAAHILLLFVTPARAAQLCVPASCKQGTCSPSLSHAPPGP